MSKVKVNLKTFKALKSMEEEYTVNGKMDKNQVLKKKVNGSFLSVRSHLNEMDIDTFLQILVNGYELEESKEEIDCHSFCEGMKYALSMLNKKVEDINF